jgi:type VI protein secretion system component Hcp
MSNMINRVEPPQRRRQTGELSELERCNIVGGSQSTGAGAGKVTFNPFSITKHVDKATTVLFL